MPSFGFKVVNGVFLSDHTEDFVGNLDLAGSTDVVTLGRLHRVRGGLDLWGSSLTSLGELLTVQGDLDLAWSKVESLGNLKRVDGNLYLRETCIDKIPPSLSIGGKIFR